VQTINYSTKDLGEAAMLLCKGQTIERLERKGNICWFVYTDPKSCLVLSNHYYFGELTVNARSYFESVNRLKKLIFNR